ncbi:MAG: SDR family NAD(P)-dependent oxidoreductase [Candidatus Aenigmatarchaeota archaeon]
MLKGKVAIVTGGTMGIGLGVADKLAALGAKVVISARHVVKTKHYFVKCDVANFKDAQNLAAQTIKKYKKIDILVNNAGIYPFTSLADMTEKQWDEVIGVNLKGTFNCTKAVLPHMIKQKYGKIVNISSIAGSCIGYPGLVHYCTTKAGQLGFARAAAIELAPYGINVNAVAPGAIETPGLAKVFDKKAMQGFLQMIPKKRIGKPKDIAEAVAFLVSDEADYITGQLMVVDGGYVMQ